MSNIPTDGLRWFNKGSAPNALTVSLRYSCWAIASTCNAEKVMLNHANAVDGSASTGEYLILKRLDIMTAGLRR